MRIRIDEKSNYKSIFFNGKTIRQSIDSRFPVLSPSTPEIEDVAINDKCFADCSYCYTMALKTGVNFSNIVEKAHDVWGAKIENERPFQIAIGGAGESTIHPNWIEFVKEVRSLNIIPNYTTNGMHLSERILQATEEFCGGVAVSYHPHIEKVFHKSIEKLHSLKTMLNVHLIVGDEISLENAKKIFEQYKEKISYFVLLPYQSVGRAEKIEVDKTWKNMFKWVYSLDKEEQEKFAFGALFYDFLSLNNISLDIDIYEPEMYSGYRIFDDSYMNVRKSSYNLSFK